MNSVVRQLHEQGTDVVMVDTGNSYEGLCEYFGGKYISYTEERPITMNPFRINREEMNVEKTGFLKNLVLLIWKGTQGTVTKTEDRLIEHVITEYYDAYFNGFEGFTPQQREDLRKSLVIDDRNSSEKRHESERERAVRIEGIIDKIEGRRKELKVEELSFNSFYEYSVQRIPDICEENRITGIDLSTYRYMMKDFYLGGNHEKTLNENMDSLVPASKISDMATGWICGQTARDFVKTKTGVGGSMNIQESEEFKTTKFFCKTDFDMKEIKAEEAAYVPLPKFYTFKSREERERILYRNFVNVGIEVKEMIKDVLNKRGAK